MYVLWSNIFKKCSIFKLVHVQNGYWDMNSLGYAKLMLSVFSCLFHFLLHQKSCVQKDSWVQFSKSNHHTNPSQPKFQVANTFPTIRTNQEYRCGMVCFWCCGSPIPMLTLFRCCRGNMGQSFSHKKPCNFTSDGGTYHLTCCSKCKNLAVERYKSMPFSVGKHCYVICFATSFSSKIKA